MTTVCCDEAVSPRGQMDVPSLAPTPEERAESGAYAAMRRCFPAATSGWFLPGSEPLGDSRITTVCCDQAVLPRGETWMVLAWPRILRREENDDGMLR